MLLVGVGGIGSPAALYLAAAGVGRMDSWIATSLSFPICSGRSSWTNDVGGVKVERARESISALNPHCVVETHHRDSVTRGSPGNCARL